MLDFRKGLLALAVAGLGIVGTASAQVTCSTVQNTNGGVAGTAATGVRSQGMTEQLQGFLITGCTGTINTATITVQVTSNVPFTNVLLTGTTNNSTDAQATSTGFGANGPVQGQLVNPTTMQFSFTIPAGNQNTSAAGATITITNLRANASTLAAGSTITLTAVGVTGIITNGTAVSSAITQSALGSVSFRGFGNVAVCTTNSGSINAVGVVAITEGFITAFTSAADENGKEPAGIANNPASGSAVGTTLALTFNGLASGAVYYLPATVTYQATGNATALSLSLVSGPTSTAPISGGTAGTSSSGSNTGTSSVSGVVGFTPTNGSFTAYYMVTADDQAHIDQTAALTNANNCPTVGGVVTCPASGVAPQTAPTYTEITLFETVASATAATPTNAAASVSVVLAGASANYPQFSSSQTAVAATASASSTVAGSGAGILNACNTTLLFPYIANVAGYDTGIAVTNASTGTSVAGNAIAAQNGACTFTFYGGGATANSPVVGSPVTVPSGTTQSFLLSNAAPGFVGYAVASRTFQGGHGFAFITDGFGGGGRGLSQGYLAVILQNTFGGALQAPNSFLSIPEISR
jgi:hypothetical protein